MSRLGDEKPRRSGRRKATGRGTRADASLVSTSGPHGY